MNTEELLYQIMQKFDNHYKWAYNEKSLWEIDSNLAEEIRSFVREYELDKMVEWNQEQGFY